MIFFLKTIGVFIGIIEAIIILRILFSIIGLKGLLSEKIYQLTEPILNLIRSTIDRTGLNTGIFDFSALILLLILRFLQNFIGKVTIK